MLSKKDVLKKFIGEEVYIIPYALGFSIYSIPYDGPRIENLELNRYEIIDIGDDIFKCVHKERKGKDEQVKKEVVYYDIDKICAIKLGNIFDQEN